ncbi:hypothetical protein ALC57_09362, partial [Trachymyrmex cornetzi]
RLALLKYPSISDEPRDLVSIVMGTRNLFGVFQHRALPGGGNTCAVALFSRTGKEVRQAQLKEKGDNGGGGGGSSLASVNTVEHKVNVAICIRDCSCIDDNTRENERKRGVTCKGKRETEIGEASATVRRNVQSPVQEAGNPKPHGDITSGLYTKYHKPKICRHFVFRNYGQFTSGFECGHIGDGIKEDHGHSPGDRIWNNFRGKYFRISLLESLDYLPLRQLIPIRKPSFLPLAQRAPFGYGTLIAKTRNERSVRTDHGIARGTIAAAPDRPSVYKYKLVFAFSDRFCQPDLTVLLIIN